MLWNDWAYYFCILFLNIYRRVNRTYMDKYRRKRALELIHPGKKWWKSMKQWTKALSKVILHSLNPGSLFFFYLPLLTWDKMRAHPIWLWFITTLPEPVFILTWFNIDNVVNSYTGMPFYNEWDSSLDKSQKPRWWPSQSPRHLCSPNVFSICAKAG